jgi:hypothetical protein
MPTDSLGDVFGAEDRFSDSLEFKKIRRYLKYIKHQGQNKYQDTWVVCSDYLKGGCRWSRV